MITPATSLRELAFIVCTALHESKITAVLTGGGAATVYAPDSYQSRDLDFVLEFSGSASERALTDLGFRKVGWSYEHPDTPLTLDFPPGPLMIGDLVVSKWDTLFDGDRRLNIITPTDSVLDRFAAYAHWREQNSLLVAAIVATSIGDSLDWKRIEAWCEAEGVAEKFTDLRAEIERLRS